MTLPDAFLAIAREVNNWGRWGHDDERGTLNLITAECVRKAATCVRVGKTFALGLELGSDGPQTGAIPGRINPLHLMTQVAELHSEDPDGVRVNDDAVVMGLQCATHWDAPAHVTYAGRMYNGFGAGAVTVEGAERCAAHVLGTIAGRGVLLDVARARGVDRLEGGEVIGPDDLDRAAELGGVEVAAGDIVLIRTGHIQLLRAGDRAAYAYPSPGPGMQAVRWFRDKDVAAVATDTLAFEVLPGEHPGLFLPVHLLHLVEMGLVQGQNFFLEELAEDCAEDGSYAFFLEASPEPFARAVGAPVQPVAIK